MDDDDEDEDEDGDGDPDAPPAPAAPLLLTSASSTSASHRWPQPPPTSTEKEKPLLNASGRSPHTGCAPQDAAPGAALGARPGGARSPRAPRSPRGGGWSPAAGALPLPPAARLRLGAVEAGGAAGAPGDGKEGGSRVQRCVRGRQSLGSVAAFQQLRLEQLRALGAGGAPRAGARLAGCLPARLRGGVKPHYTGFNVSRRPAGTRAPEGRRERRGLAAGEKSGHGARKRPRPRTFLPGAAPTRSAARGGSGSGGARPPARGPRAGHRPKGTPEPPPRGPSPAVSPSLYPPRPPGAGAAGARGARSGRGC
ncbi:translation initiation factor IF-2-like isoform X2 [Pyrgilauda ruficollis]|uniref:translation initiation factor IF-2-like isoform X2 n=1 Tax=Pyrgilauda ruficollis TaxID=221976 RepID=UPI001B88067B|nr:translation initiation factor IF-2-like isoform X2 [Pyrgilauda ruficollis]